MDRISNHLLPPESWKGCCLTIGNFDGVHVGHAALLGHLRAMARPFGTPAVAMTFFPHPVTVLTGHQVPSIQTLEDRVDSLLARGADGVWVYPFSATFAALTPREFVECILVEALAIKGMVIGPDFRFGARRAGNSEMLRQFGEEFGFHVTELNEPVLVGDLPASSSRVRTLLNAGDLAGVEQVLGAPYRLTGVVQHGAGLGRRLGFPTANIQPPDGLILPPPGVYAATVRMADDSQALSAVSLGTRPTFDNGALWLEAHLLDVDRDLYGQTIQVSLHHRVRPELRFDGADQLIQAMHQDLVAIRSWFKNR